MPRLQDIRFLAEYGLFRAVAALLHLLPLDLAVSLAASVAGAIGPWTTLHRRALSNLTAAYPEATNADRERIASAMWKNTGRALAENLLIDRIIKDPDRIEIVGREELEREFRTPGAHIGLTLHMGNWEFAAWGFNVCGAKPAGIYRPQRNPHIDRFLLRLREPLAPGGLLFKGAKYIGMPLGQTMRVVIDYLRKGGDLGLICDQVEDRSGFTVPFFGHAASFTPAPALVARRMGARIWMGRCLRIDDRCRFRIESRELPVQHSNDMNADVQATTAAMASQFEEWIRDAPDQWMWWLRRSIGENRG